MDVSQSNFAVISDITYIKKKRIRSAATHSWFLQSDWKAGLVRLSLPDLLLAFTENMAYHSGRSYRKDSGILSKVTTDRLRG